MASNTDLQNRFAVRAALYAEMTDQQAQRIAASTDQPPANSTDVAGKPELAKAWNYSPSPQPEQDFWALHDQKLQQNLAQVQANPPSDPADLQQAVQAAHNDAETATLNQVYPYRADLIGIGSRVLEDQVSQAERIKRIVEGRQEQESSGGPAQ